MNNTLTIETYKDTGITFREDAWVNATQMAKPFGKLVTGFTRTQSAQAFIAALEKQLTAENEGVMQKCITVVQGGLTQGTWMHPDLALEFARWLSPEFAIWTNRVIRRIMAGEQPATVDLSPIVHALRQTTDCLGQVAVTIASFEKRISALEAATHVPKVLPQQKQPALPAPRKRRYPTPPRFHMPVLSQLDDDYKRAFNGLPAETIRKIFLENNWINPITGRLNHWVIRRRYAYHRPTWYDGNSITVTLLGARYLHQALVFHWRVQSPMPHKPSVE